MLKPSHYIELANEYLEKIEKLKEDSNNHSSLREKRIKEQKLIDTYNEYRTRIRPQLEDSGIELHKYDSRIERIVNSI